MEEVRVAWAFRGKVDWWSVDVINIGTSTNPKQNTEEVIRYGAQRRYEAEDHIVQFDPVPRKGPKTVRSMNNDSKTRSVWCFTEERFTSDCITPGKKVHDVGDVGAARTTGHIKEAGVRAIRDDKPQSAPVTPH